jgi:hypothetical protein
MPVGHGLQCVKFGCGSILGLVLPTGYDHGPPSLLRTRRCYLPKQFCPIRSDLVAQLTSASIHVTETVDLLKVLSNLRNRNSAKNRKEIFELTTRRNAGIVECGQLLQKLGDHRNEHDC